MNGGDGRRTRCKGERRGRFCARAVIHPRRGRTIGNMSGCGRLTERPFRDAPPGHRRLACSCHGRTST